MEAAEVFDTVLKKLNELEKEVIAKVLEQAYKRPPTDEDFKNIELRYYGNNQDKFIVAIEGIEVGTVHRSYMNPILNTGFDKIDNTFKVEFTPYKEFSS